MQNRNSKDQNQQVSQPNANMNVGRILVKKKVWIKHIDGISTVLAKAIIGSGEVEFEYKFEGMVYGQTLSVKQCIEFGYINKVRANNNFREMKKRRRMGNRYRCPLCKKIVKRNNERQWIKSFCDSFGKDTRLIKI